MIVLRWAIRDRPDASQELRTTKSRIVLGSGAQADVRLRDAGWASREAILRHAGTEVHLVRPGREEVIVVRVGDVVHLGRAAVTLAGLLPRTETPKPTPSPSAGPPPIPSPTSSQMPAAATAVAAAGPVLFGGYDDPIPATPSVSASAEGRGGFVLAPAETTTSPAAAGATAATAAGALPGVPASEPTGEPTHEAHSAWAHDDFGLALLHGVRKAPFYALSLAFHALVLIACWLLLSTTEKKPQRTWGFEASIASPAREEGDPTPTHDEVPAPLTEALPEFPEPVEIVVPVDPTVPPTKEPTPTLPPLDAPEMPLTIGVQPTLAAAGARTPRRLPTPPKFDAKRVFRESEAEAVNDKAAGAVRDAIGIGSGGKGAALDTLSKIDILVVEGGFDKMNQVLDSLKLPYQLVRPSSLTQPNAPPLSQHKAIFWNCGESLSKRDLQIVGRKLKGFVEGGGYLFTTDWCIENLLPYAFPGYVTSTGRKAPLPETVVDVEPETAHRDDPLLDGVFLPGVQGRWWLEQQSFDIRVLRKDDVQVLVRSRDLADLYGRDGAVAVTFHAGRGRVLHVMGHYWQKAGNIAGTMAAQRLALNFVLMRLDQGD